ncbi:MAG: selenide, water dikinase SelD [Candidatus Puniceispirillaceae bacterium]
MNHQTTAKHLHLVLIGGGHAQIAVLKSFAMAPVLGLQITLITDVLYAPYSGMLPAFIEGIWSFDDIHIDLTRLASLAGARVIQAPVNAIDTDTKQVHITGRPPVHYDILSINSGAVPDKDKIKNAESYAIAVKPIAHLIDKLPQTIKAKQRINIIGAGVAGLELAFAFHTKFRSQAPEIHVFSRSKNLLPSMARRAGKIALAQARQRDITIHLGAEITAIDKDTLYDSHDNHYPSGLNLIVTSVKAADFVKSLQDSLTDTSFIAVGETLQTKAYPAIFAAGDAASVIGHPREKAGVFAVRAGPILAQNIRRFIHNQPLRRWQPQKRYLALIGTADGKAIAVRGRFVAYGAIWWHLKSYIDRAFIQKFTSLPEMAATSPDILPYYQSQHPALDDPILKDMRCAGCAAKASATLLETAMASACKAARELGADASYLPKQGALAEDASLTPPCDSPQRHSFDSLTQMVSDPFEFAMIAANHALSDLYVCGALPDFATAHLNLAEASEPRQLDDAIHMLTGAFLTLSQAKVKLIGGHTSQSLTTSLGFAVTGRQHYELARYDSQKDYVVLMTKRLGIGIGLAAIMRQQKDANLYRALIAEMLISNQQAAALLFQSEAIAMTDITGFGLARHSQNLTNKLGFGSLAIQLSKLAYFDGIDDIIRNGLRSSIHNQNQQAASFAHFTPSAAHDWRQALLFDPQTSGGVCAIIPADKADSCLSALSHHSARIIGAFRPDGSDLLIEI